MIRFTTAFSRGLRACWAGAATAVLTGALLSTAPGTAWAAKKNDTLRMVYTQILEHLDPYYNNTRIGVILTANVWDTLLYRDPVTNEYVGQLAKSWRWVDERTMEFELRQGVRFHNGEEFDADAVVYTLNFVADPKNQAVTQQNVRWIDRVEKLDQYRVRIITKEVFPAAPEYLSTTVAMHPPKYYAEVGPAGMNAKPVGSGPYKIVEHRIGQSVTLERNDDYFKDSPKGQPKIGKVVIRFIPDIQTQMAEIISGGQDFMMYVPKDQSEQIRRMPHLQVKSGETMRLVFLQMNIRDDTPAPQLKDERVRRAINHAIDRDAILKNIVGEGAELINAVCSPSQTGCSQDIPSYPYDPALAKKLLAEAGYPNGFEIGLASYRDRDQVEAIINYLQAVGIKVNLQFMQYAAMRDNMVRTGKGALMHHTWGSNLVNDLSASTPVFFGMGNDDTTRDAALSALLDQGDTTADPQQRVAVYKQALTLMYERAYAVPLWVLPVYYAATSDLVFEAYKDEMVRFWAMDWK